MMAVVILVFSLISLLLFFLSYCRSLVASSTKEACRKKSWMLPALPIPRRLTTFRG